MTATSPGRHPGTSGPAQEPAGPAGLIWTRPPKEKRERPTREAIVAAAIGLADTDGLDAVSIRRVAAALQTRPMDLYRYFARKDELIDLMVDEVIAGALLDEIPHDWRDALSAIACALRAVCLAHPWMVTAAGQQALLGPNVMRHVEQSLEATAALGLDWTKRLAIWRAVDSYTMGHAHIRPGRDHSEGNTAPDPGRRPRPRHTCRTSPAPATSRTSPPAAPPACCTPTTTSSPSRPGSTGSSPASPQTAKQSPHRAACRPRFPGPLFARGYVRSRDYVQARQEASPRPASGCDRRQEQALVKGALHFAAAGRLQEQVVEHLALGVIERSEYLVA